jgi:hypothetical protein
VRQWILLVYKVPNEPSAKRVAIWRKLKRLGAILLHDGAWILPATDQTREQFQWLASEIVEMDGEASVWDSQILPGPQEQALIREFVNQVDETYREILSELDKRVIDLSGVSRRYQQALAQDYFDSPLGQRVRKSLLAARAFATP